MKILKEVLKEFSDKKFLYHKPNSGNHGDTLIGMGERKIFDSLGLQMIDRITDQKNTVIYVNGMGTIGKMYGSTYVAVSNLVKRFPEAQIIIGPSTIVTGKEDIEYLKEVLPKENIIFFAREKTTYDAMSQNFSFPVYLDECPSFQVTIKDLGIKDSTGDGVALFDRVDDGRPGRIGVFPEPIDFSTDLALQKDEHGNFIGFREWVDLHNRFAKIYTNRTHSAVLGWILGKETYIYNNSYHKNRSMWEFSLKKRGVKWIGN